MKLVKKKLELICLVLLFLLALAVRLPKINQPLADWHSFRQADTAAVARHYLNYGYNLLVPKYDDLSSIQSGIDNLEGYRFVEFPFYNFIHAITYDLFDFLGFELLNFEGAGRLVSIIFWLIGGAYFYLLVKKLINIKTAFLSLFFYLFLPFAIFYSRTILPEPTMIGLILISSYYFLSWTQNLKILPLAISLLTGSLAILVKPYAIFLLGPFYFIGFIKKKKITLGALFAGLLFIPFFAWRKWMSKFPSGIPSNQWLFNAGGMRFMPAWWRWLFGERIGKLILGYWGTALLVPGLIKKINDKNIYFFSWIAGIFLYFSVFARGNIQHDYYQIITIPVLSVFMGLGVVKLIPKSFSWEKAHSYIIISFSIAFSIALSWYQVKEYYLINNPVIIEAGNKANEILPKDAKIIAPYNGDTAFLYQTNRKGWPVVNTNIEKLIELGAQYYVSVNYDQTTNYLIEQKYKILEQNSKYIIIDLQQKEK